MIIRVERAKRRMNIPCRKLVTKSHVRIQRMARQILDWKSFDPGGEVSELESRTVILRDQGTNALHLIYNLQLVDPSPVGYPMIQ
jgi:hypothetical protein